MKKILILILMLTIILSGCDKKTDDWSEVDKIETEVVQNVEIDSTDNPFITEQTEPEPATEEPTKTIQVTTENQTTNEKIITTEPETQIKTTDENIFEGYELIEVYGGDLSGDRKANVVVDIGFGERVYWAFTNEYGQLVRVIAAEIILQKDSEALDTGRYYPDEAKVPGVESKYLDEGHVIADSLGGVSNAYNITPQNSILNRNGDQAYMEKVIRTARGCLNFEAIITYPDTKTQIPSKYKYTYTINGEVITDEFENIDPDVENYNINVNYTEKDIVKIDTNGNGTVTIKEAKAAGFTMPIRKDFWLYKYMNDADGNGSVGD